MNSNTPTAEREIYQFIKILSESGKDNIKTHIVCGHLLSIALKLEAERINKN